MQKLEITKNSVIWIGTIVQICEVKNFIDYMIRHFLTLCQLFKVIYKSIIIVAFTAEICIHLYKTNKNDNKVTMYNN